MHAARDPDLLHEAVVEVVCPDCQGSGRFDDVDCWHCRGMGALALDGGERATSAFVRAMWRDVGPPSGS
jgi:hypothetical protein